MNAVLKSPIFEEEVPDGFEMSEGRLVELNMSFASEWIGGKIVTALNNYLMTNPIGLAATNPTFRCFPRSRRTCRKPHVVFVRNGQWPDDLPPDTDASIPPDLAVEVISPNDEAFELEQKMVDYRSVKIPLIWIIYPNTRTAYVHRIDGRITCLTDQDHLDGEDILPGFRCPLADVLPKPRVAVATTESEPVLNAP